jgi:hypothetical protein
MDESYGNTPLHIACSLHSYVITKMLLQNSDLSQKNFAGRTPEEVIDNEI